MIGSTNAGGGGKCFAFIVTTYPSGSTCTCTSSSATGSKVLKTKGTGGSWVFKVPFADTWTVAITDASHTTPVTKNVDISTEGQSESVSLSYFPSNFTRIEYLESSNSNAYISSNYRATVNDVVTVEFEMTESNKSCFYGTGTAFYCGCYASATALDTTMGFTYDKSYVLNEKIIGTGTPTSALSSVPYIFATHGATAANYYGKGRIYDIEIKTSGVTSHHYVPCYRNSDSKLGMLDIVGETVLGFCEGSGTFKAGGNV